MNTKGYFRNKSYSKDPNYDNFYNYYDDEYSANKNSCDTDYDEDKKNCDKKDVCYNNCKKHSCDKDNNEKNLGCCCDTTELRNLLRIFSRNNSPVIVFTETKSIDPGILFVFVKSIVDDMVYFSLESTNGPVRYIIPIGDISFIIAVTSPTLDSVTAIINRIAENCNKAKDPCCQRDGIGDTLNSIGEADLLLPLSSGLYTISTTGLVSGFVWTTERMSFNLFLSDTVLRAANDDILILYSTEDDTSAYIIVPTCKIDTIVLPTPDVTSNNETLTKSNLNVNLFPLTDEKIKDKDQKVLSINKKTITK